MEPPRELLSDCWVPSSSFKTPLRFPHPAPLWVVRAVFLTCNPSLITLLINGYVYEVSRVALHGSFLPREMFTKMQSTIKKTRYKTIHYKVEIEYNTLELTCDSLGTLKALLGKLWIECTACLHFKNMYPVL